MLVRLPVDSLVSVSRIDACSECSTVMIRFSFFLEIFEANLDFAAMLFQNAEGREKDRGPSGLSALEIEAIDMFINFLKIIGLQRSIGEIYGLLFVSAKPLSMGAIRRDSVWLA
jgi:hypothetical protein